MLFKTRKTVQKTLNYKDVPEKLHEYLLTVFTFSYNSKSYKTILKQKKLFR